MSARFVSIFAIFLLLISCACTSTDTERDSSAAAATLRSLAEEHGLYIGSAVAPRMLGRDSTYAETLAREFNILTAENAMKFSRLHPAPDRYNFSPSDTLVDFAQTHRMRVRGHTLVWHLQLARWVTERERSRDELLQIMHDHISTVVGRYRGRVWAWDVINEGVADDGTLRDTPWLRGIGPDYMDFAFRWAHEADPDGLLFYNETGAEGLGRKSDAVYALMQDLLKRGVPVHGVGLQLHIGLENSPAPKDVLANMNRLAALGLQVHITELDVRIPEPVTDEKLAAQAAIYKNLLATSLAAENCTAFVMWGFTDRYSWIPRFFRGHTAGLIFDELYQPKPAYHALCEVLAGGFE